MWIPQPSVRLLFEFSRFAEQFSRERRAQPQSGDHQATSHGHSLNPTPGHVIFCRLRILAPALFWGSHSPTQFPRYSRRQRSQFPTPKMSPACRSNSQLPPSPNWETKTLAPMAPPPNFVGLLMGAQRPSRAIFRGGPLGEPLDPAVF